MRIKKNEWVKIPPKKMFKIWKKYRSNYYIEIICPFCHEFSQFTHLQTFHLQTLGKIQLDCYCEIPRHQSSPILEIYLTPKYICKDWISREGHPHEWKLRTDAHSSQPIGVHLYKFEHKVDGRNKDGYQATLGEFAGRFCYIAPVRESLSNALEDCYSFMQNNTNLKKLKVMLSEYSFNPKFS